MTDEANGRHNKLMVDGVDNNAAGTKSVLGGECNKSLTSSSSSLSSIHNNNNPNPPLLMFSAVKSISIHLHGIDVSGERGGTPSYHPGDTIKGSVLVVYNGKSDLAAKKSPFKKQRPSAQELRHSYATKSGSAASSGSTASSNSSQTAKLSTPHHHNDNENDKNEPANTVTLSLKGYGKVRLAAKIYKVQRVFIDEHKEILVPTETSSESHYLLFDFKLPETLPPSFDGNHARIRYRIRAKYNGVSDAVMPLEVRHNGQMDDSVHTGPDDDYDRRHMSFCCLSYGTRSVSAKIERSIYQYQGDVVLLNARFHNLRDKEAQPYVKLVQWQTCHLEIFGSKKLKKSFCEWLLVPDADLTPIEPRKDRTWCNVRCGLPAVVPSFRSPVLSVDYFLEIGLMETGSIFKNPVVSLAIYMASGSSATIDHVHLYISGRKHHKTTVTANGELQNSNSANSYLSVIAEALREDSEADEMEHQS